MEPRIAKYRSFGDKISANLKLCNIATRPRASHGLWVSGLLPVTLGLCALKFETSHVYKVVFAHSVALALTSWLFAIFTSITHRNLAKWNDAFGPSLASALFSVFFFDYGVPYSILSGFTLCFGFKYLLKSILVNCSSSFTLGEAILVAQSIVLFVFASVSNAIDPMFRSTTNDGAIITLILQIGILFVMLVVNTLFILRKNMTIVLFTSIVLSYIALMLGALHVILDRSPVLWIVLYVFDNFKRISMVMYWVIASILAIIAVNYQISVNSKATTSQRKIFHLLSVIVYVPGILYECNLTFLASGIAIAALIALETVRKLDLGWFSQVLNNGFKVFSDEKDAGGLSITPIYLLLGTACPLFLHPLSCTNYINMALFSGVLSIGIGDSAASYFGSHFGRHKWPGTSKSVEGSVANFVSQFLTIIGFHLCGYITLTETSCILFAIAFLVNCTVEAITDQVDNLMLPLITFAILILAS